MTTPTFGTPLPGEGPVMYRLEPVTGILQALVWVPSTATFDVVLRGPFKPHAPESMPRLSSEIVVQIDDTIGLVWVGNSRVRNPWRIRGMERQERFLEGLVAFGGYDHTNIEVVGDATTERTLA